MKLKINKFAQLMDILFEYDNKNYNELYYKFRDSEPVSYFKVDHPASRWRYNIFFDQIQVLEIQAHCEDFRKVCNIVISEMKKNKISLIMFN